MNKLINYFKKLTPKEATKFLVIFYIVGITGFLIPALRGFFELLIPVSLLINLFMLLLFHPKFDRKHLLFFGGVVVFTFSIEAIGVNTGLLFGEYSYGKSLPGKIFETPVIIGFNWLMLSYGAVELIRPIKSLRRFLPVLVGLLMTAFDFVMEPVAMRTDMWGWGSNHIPLQNYVLWFIVSVVVASCFELFGISTNNKLAPRIFLFQGIFFVVLHLFLS